MNNRQAVARIGQYICIALMLCCFFEYAARAQSLWQVTDTSQYIDTAEGQHGWKLYALDCKVGWCVAALAEGYTVGVNYSSRLKLKQSFDFGMTWSEYDPSVPLSDTDNSHYMAVNVFNDQEAIAVADKGNIVKTADRGVTWTHVPSPRNYPWWDVAYTDSLHGMLLNPGHCFGTTDGGRNWNEARFHNPVSTCHAFGNGKYSVFNFGANGKICTTTDSWITCDSSAAPPQFAEDSAHRLIWGKGKWVAGDTIVAMGNEYYYDTVAKGPIYRGILCVSDDNGHTWNQPYIDSLLPSFTAVSGFNGDTVYASARLVGGWLCKSTNRGRTWVLDTVQFTTPVPVTDQFPIALEDAGDGVFIGAFDKFPYGSNAFFARQVRGPLSVREKVTLLSISVYPNPAISTISISESKVDRVELRDLLGRRILGQDLESSSHSVNVSSLPRGCYEVLLYDKNVRVSCSKLILSE